MGSSVWQCVICFGKKCRVQNKVTQSISNNEVMSVRVFHTLSHHTNFLTNSISINMCRNRTFFSQFTAHGSVLEHCKKKPKFCASHSVPFKEKNFIPTAAESC